MNRRMVFYTIGRILNLEAGLLLIPLAVAVCFGEWTGVKAFAVSALAALAAGLALCLLLKPKTKVIYAKEGFATATLVWIAVSLFGSLPFMISGEISNFFDAFFETVSGFTTTGASILKDVEAMSRGMLFWRSFTHWIGGMGVLVLMMAIVPTDSGRSIHIMRAEMAGPVVGKLVPKIKETARILYLIYFVLTVVEFVFLLFGGMPVYDSAVYSLGTAGTGGYGIKADSVSSYSPYLQWVIAIFMIIFAINFNLFYFVLLGRFKTALKNAELWCYLGITAAATGIVAFSIYPLYNNFGDSVRHSLFQVSSIMSTTGYSTADFNLWPSLAKGVLFILLFVGGCAGSTAGGLKISRVLIIFKMIQRDIRKMLHPHAVASVRIDGKPVDNSTLHRVSTYFTLYSLLIAATFLLISFDSFDFETNLTAAVTCVNNVGPGFGAVGPMGGYGDYSDFSTFVLSLAMLLGRLEIYPMLLSLDPKIWVKK